MNRLQIVLVIALIGSALLLVRTAYEARRTFSQLDQARREQALLDAEFRRLDAERQVQSTHGLVEKAARERLQMRSAGPAVTAYVVDPASGVPR